MKETSPVYNWYEKILAKPETYRKRLALLLTVLLGIIIVATWLFVTAYQIQNVFKNDLPTTETSSQNDNPPTTTKKDPLQLEKNNEIFNNE